MGDRLGVSRRRLGRGGSSSEYLRRRVAMGEGDLDRDKDLLGEGDGRRLPPSNRRSPRPQPPGTYVSISRLGGGPR